MPAIRLKRLPHRTPVKMVIHLPPDLHAALSDYSEFYREAYGESAMLPDLVPAMLEAFLLADRAFARRPRSSTPPAR